MKATGRDHGFCLLELLVGLLILGLLLILWAAAYPSHSPATLLENGAREIQSRLYSARYKAVFEGRKARVTFDGGSCTLDLYSPEQGDWERKMTSFIDGVNIEANNRPIFHPAGTVSNLATIQISNSAGLYTITIAISGRIKLTKI